MTLATWLIMIAHNPVFAGIVGGAGTTAILYNVRRIPVVLFGWVRRACTVSLLIDNDDTLFDRLCVYLSEAPFVRRAKWLRMVEMYDYDQQRWCWRASFGQGWHLFREDGHWFLLHRHGERDGKALIPKRIETITVRSFGRDQGPIRDLMSRAEKVYQGCKTVRVHLWHAGGYLIADQKPVRGPETLFLPDDQRERIVNDLTRFLGRQEEYRRRGTPYRRGYLFAGPPGTGKTTLALVLAGIARRPIYMINPNTAGGDTGLQAAFSSAEPGSVIVIEDIDSSKMARVRDFNDGAAPIEVKPDEVVTLGGLLNAIDGLGSRDNRILILTSNHADMLDPALLRPGRVDLREEIGLMDEGTARRMTVAWGADQRWFEREVKPICPITPSRMQELLLAAVEGLDLAA